jgi:hypothetical protein
MARLSDWTGIFKLRSPFEQLSETSHLGVQAFGDLLPGFKESLTVLYKTLGRKM